MTSHSLRPLAGTIPSPFGYQGFIAMHALAYARRTRMPPAVLKDIEELQKVSGAGSPRRTTAQLPDAARAYRILVRCALLSAVHLSEVYDIRTNAALKRIRELPEGAEDRSASVRDFTDLLIQTMSGAPADAAQFVANHYTTAIETLVQWHWPTLRQAAAFWETPKRVEVKRREMLQKMRELRRISMQST